jgi:hypothetical protein
LRLRKTLKYCPGLVDHYNRTGIGARLDLDLASSAWKDYMRSHPE